MLEMCWIPFKSLWAPCFCVSKEKKYSIFLKSSCRFFFSKVLRNVWLESVVKSANSICIWRCSLEALESGQSNYDQTCDLTGQLGCQFSSITKTSGSNESGRHLITRSSNFDWRCLFLNFQIVPPLQRTGHVAQQQPPAPAAQRQPPQQPHQQHQDQKDDPAAAAPQRHLGAGPSAAADAVAVAVAVVAVAVVVVAVAVAVAAAVAVAVAASGEPRRRGRRRRRARPPFDAAPKNRWGNLQLIDMKSSFHSAWLSLSTWWRCEMKADERRAHWFIMTSLRFENQSASENWGPTLCAAPSSNSSIRVLNDPSISMDYDSAFRTAFVKSMLSRALNENSIVSFLFFSLFFFTLRNEIRRRRRLDGRFAGAARLADGARFHGEKRLGGLRAGTGRAADAPPAEDAARLAVDAPPQHAALLQSALGQISDVALSKTRRQQQQQLKRNGNLQNRNNGKQKLAVPSPTGALSAGMRNEIVVSA